MPLVTGRPSRAPREGSLPGRAGRMQEISSSAQNGQIEINNPRNIIYNASMPKTLDAEECGAFLKCSSGMVLELAAKGILPGAKIGRGWVFIEDDILEFLREQVRIQVEGRKETHGMVLVHLIPANPKRPGRPRKPLPRLPKVPLDDLPLIRQKDKPE